MLNSLFLLVGLTMAQSAPEAATDTVSAPEPTLEESPDPVSPEPSDDATTVDGDLPGSEPIEEPEAIPTYPLVYAGQVTSDSKHYDLEVDYAEGRHQEGLTLAQQRWTEQPDDPELGWIIARFMYEIGEQFERTDDSVDKEAWYKQMWAITDKGLEMDPDNPHLLFARGIAVGRYGTTRGVLASLFLAKRVEADWLAAAESGHVYSSLKGSEKMPCDVYQGLSIFYRLVPDWWIVQVLAGTRGDLSKSVDYAERADACAPNTIRHLKELGVARICQAQKTNNDGLLASGKESIRSYLKLTPGTSIERIDMLHGKQLLDDPKLACEYSRDGQQDLDKKNLDEGEAKAE